MNRKAVYPLAFAVVAATLFAISTPLRASETDDRVESLFQKSYVYKTYLKDDAITTTTKDGVATLTGQVSEPNHRYLAQELLSSLPGVTRVDNRLGVTLEGAETSDTWIRAKVRSILALHRNVSGSGTQVDVREGVITLRGVATSEAQKELATEYAKDVQGVLLVTNVMTVAVAPEKDDRTANEKMDDASITAQVRTALLTHRSTSSLRTKVETRDGEVALTGMAKNAAEKVLVTKLVADIHGVRSVNNQMTIAESTTR